MVTGFDIIGTDKHLQEHWIRRIVAYIIDIIIVALAIWFVFLFIGIKGWIEYGLFSGLIFLLYCVVLEATSNKTIGKAILSLEVSATSGLMDFYKAFVRNISKALWYIFPALDLILGLATEGDPRQRFLDRVAGTTVISYYEPTPGPQYRRSPSIGNPYSKTPVEMCIHCGAPLHELQGGRFQCSSCGIIQ
jgi:uncharacterized RDD family membrane protein YckC